MASGGRLDVMIDSKLLACSLGGGLIQTFLEFSTRIPGEMIPNLTGAYFSNGLVQPPTSSHHSSQIGPFGPFLPSFLASKCFDDLDGSLSTIIFDTLKKNIEN